MPGGPPSFSKFWEEVQNEGPFTHEARKEFRRRIEKEINLLERLAHEWETQSKRLGYGAAQELEQDLCGSARAGLERIRRTGEADIMIRRKRSAKAERLSA